MVRPQVVDRADDLVLRKIVANTLLSQSRGIHKFGFCVTD